MPNYVEKSNHVAGQPESKKRRFPAERTPLNR